LILVILGGLWWLINNRQLTERPEAERAAQGTQQKTPEPGPLITQQNSPDAGSNGNQQQEENQREANRQSNLTVERNRRAPNTSNKNVASRKDSSLVATFTLMPGAMRDGAENNIVTVRPGTTSVRLKIFPGESSYKTYEAALQTASSVEVWRGTGLRARTVNTNPQIVLTVPAGKLTQNSYTLILYGLKPGGDKEEVNYYRFKVAAK
jgi:hypothetical protein